MHVIPYFFTPYVLLNKICDILTTGLNFKIFRPLPLKVLFFYRRRSVQSTLASVFLRSILKFLIRRRGWALDVVKFKIVPNIINVKIIIVRLPFFEFV